MAKGEAAKISTRKKVRLYDKCSVCKTSDASKPMVYLFPRKDRPVHEQCRAA